MLTKIHIKQKFINLKEHRDHIVLLILLSLSILTFLDFSLYRPLNLNIQSVYAQSSVPLATPNESELFHSNDAQSYINLKQNNLRVIQEIPNKARLFKELPNRIKAIQERKTRFKQHINQYAQDLHITLESHVVYTHLQLIQRRYGLHWNSYLQKTGQTEKGVLAKIKQNLIQQKVIEQLAKQRKDNHSPISHPVLPMAARSMTDAEEIRLWKKRVIEEIYQSIDQQLQADQISIKSVRVKTQAIHTDFVSLPHKPFFRFSSSYSRSAIK
jgi:hypothetical protein